MQPALGDVEPLDPAEAEQELDLNTRENRLKPAGRPFPMSASDSWLVGDTMDCHTGWNSTRDLGGLEENRA
jgi:hypothetical protein